jgi:DNA-binding MarR family transcriptional regulator
MSNWYITIPANILIDKQIPNTAKILYGVISNQQSMNGVCTLSNTQLSEYLNVSTTQVSALISKLEKSNLISRKIIYNDKKQIVKRELKIIDRVLKKTGTPYTRKHEIPIQENTKDKNKYYKNIDRESVKKIIIT